jgi:hypothetical protein
LPLHDCLPSFQSKQWLSLNYHAFKAPPIGSKLKNSQHRSPYLRSFTSIVFLKKLLIQFVTSKSICDTHWINVSRKDVGSKSLESF